MNYGQKLLHILIAGAGMMIFVIGLAYRTGYFTGQSGTSSTLMITAGIAIAIIGLVKMKND